MAYISDTYTRQREARSICSKQSLQTQTHQRLKSLSVRSFILICRKSRRRRTRARESILNDEGYFKVIRSFLAGRLSTSICNFCHYIFHRQSNRP